MQIGSINSMQGLITRMPMLKGLPGVIICLLKKNKRPTSKMESILLC